MSSVEPELALRGMRHRSHWPECGEVMNHSSPRMESRRETLPGSEGRTYQCGARNSRLRASPLHHHGDGRGGTGNEHYFLLAFNKRPRFNRWSLARLG